MTLSTKVKCPYCGHEQNCNVDKAVGHEVTLCYPEDGGCDNYYAVFWKASLSATTGTINIGKNNTSHVPRPSYVG